MSYRFHRLSAKITGVVVLAFVTMQCIGNGIRDWRLSPAIGLIWVFPAAMSMWFFLTFKRAEHRRIDPDNPFWEAAGDDYIKVMVIGAVMIMLEFVFRP